MVYTNLLQCPLIRSVRSFFGATDHFCHIREIDGHFLFARVTETYVLGGTFATIASQGNGE